MGNEPNSDVSEVESFLREVAAVADPEAFDHSLAPLNPGDLLSERFALRRAIGEGAFGMVYEAEDRRDGGLVALKMLRSAQPDWLYRFKREFRGVQGLSHPNLVRLDELFFCGDRWFFTMELVDGVDFVSHVRNARATVACDSTSQWANIGAEQSSEHRTRRQEVSSFEERLRDALRQLLEGLGALHALDKVHRDIKPSNILVTRHDRVVLLDFGLLTEELQANASALVGTPSYMAPEQAASREVAPAADLYAVGVVLYELLTGRMPIEGSPLQVLINKQTREPPPPASIVPRVPRDLNELCVRLLRRDPTKRPSASEALGSLGGTPLRHAQMAPSSRSPEMRTFVGRRAELASLRAAFDTSMKGNLATALISGESGIGKSSLVRRFTGQLLGEFADAVILEGRCYEREQVPYKTLDGIVDALSRRLSGMHESDVAALLPTRPAVLGQIFPVMRRVPQIAKEDGNLPIGADLPELRQRAFRTLRELVTRIAVRHPLVIVIDDLQWADDDGLGALAEVLCPPDAPPLLFIGTTRMSPENGSARLERIRDAIPSPRLIELARLGQEEARDLAASLLQRIDGARGDPNAIAAEAGRHPLFVEELVRHVALGGASSPEMNLDGAIWSRLGPLEQTTRQIVELVAIAGKPLPQEVAAAALNCLPAEFHRRAASLRASNLVRTGGARWVDAIEPYHDRVREAVVARLPPDRQRALHEALAIALEASTHADPETLAIHWQAAGDMARAAGHARTAGDQASQAFAFDHAARWYEQAFDLLSDGHASRRELRIKLGEALGFAGRGVLAAPHLEAAAAESPPGQALALRCRAAEQLLRSGHYDRGLEACRVALAAAGVPLPRTRFGTFASLVYYGLRLRLRGLRFRERAKSELSAEELGRIDTTWAVGMTGGLLVCVRAGLVPLLRSVLFSLAAGEIDRIARSVAVLAMLSGFRGNRSWRRTERLLRYVAALAERSGSNHAHGWAEGAAAGALHYNGRFRQSVEHCNRALEILNEDPTGFVYDAVPLRNVRIQALAFLGRFKELRLLQREGLREALARGDLYAATNMRIGLHNLAWLVDDQPELAEAEAQAALREWSRREFHVEHYKGKTALVAARLYVGDAEGAHALAVDLFKSTRPSSLWNIQNLRLRLLYLRGGSSLAMLSRGLGARDSLLREVTQDARAIERDRMPWMMPFAIILRAGIAHHQGAREDALRGLDAAAREFDAADMKAYATAARDRAARLRGGPLADLEIERAAGAMRYEAVVAPQRMMAMLVPGLDA